MSGATVNDKDKWQLNDIGLAAGWYMIEVRPTSQTLGYFLEFRTYSDTNGQCVSGAQTIQLASARTAKRVLHIKERAQSISVCSSCPQHPADFPDIVLVRLSAAFARKRLVKALPHKALPSCHHRNGDSQVDSQLLYRWYSELCPVPDIDTTYRNLAKSAIFPLTSSTLDSAAPGNYTVVYVDAVNHEQSSCVNPAPYVIITSRNVQVSAEFPAILKTLARANRKQTHCLWYTDHDHYTKNGDRSHPKLKPSSNKGLLRQGNYIGPLVICTRELYEQLGGIDSSLVDSAMLLFLLKAFDCVHEDSIKRIPRICYSVSVDQFQSPHGFHTGVNDKRAFETYLRQAPKNNLRLAAGIYPSTWQLLPGIPTSEPSVDILIATRDKVDLLSQCVASIFRMTNYKNFTITVLDNDSIEQKTHDFHQQMSRDSRYRQIDCPGDFNFSAMNNMAADQSHADLLILLNNDTEVHQPDWLERMVSELIDCDVACVGARLLYPNGLLQHAGIVTGLQGVAGHIHQFAPTDDDGYSGRIRLSPDVSAVTGACLGIRRVLYKELGGLDADNLKVAYNDVDLCLRARNSGYRNRYLGDVVLTHHESISRGADDDAKKRARLLSEVAYMEKAHGDWISDDPAWHPYFSRRHATPFLTINTEKQGEFLLG
ncbi:MAG: glycosyltransferase [Granulosicoccus sp.]